MATGAVRMAKVTERLCRMVKENPCGMSDTALGAMADGMEVLMSKHIQNGLTMDRLAQYYGVAVRTIERWRKDSNDFPEPIDPYAKTLLFPMDKVIEWKDSHKERFI